MSVYTDTVFLHEDFEVGPGPKYHVYLVPKESIRSSSDLGETMFVHLGQLKAFKGSQNYAIPAGVDLRQYPSVVIWCEQFSVLISPADLAFDSGSGHQFTAPAPPASGRDARWRGRARAAR